jgi:DNA ligase-1
MLAATMVPKKNQSMETLEFPVMASCKFDGIRCCVPETILRTRTLKLVANDHINMMLPNTTAMQYLDGELITYTDGVMDDFNVVQSKVMNADGQPDFKLHVFDHFGTPDATYETRIATYKEAVKAVGNELLVAVDTVLCHTLADLNDALALWLAQGYEGAIVRDPYGVYKFGRSTWNQKGMTKVKPMETQEATVLGFVEGFTNTNEKTRDERGKAKRSSSKAGKLPNGTLGKMLVKSEEFGMFYLSAGSMTKVAAQHVWDNKRDFRFAKATYKFQRIGMKDKPRIAVFQHFRHADA